MKIKYKFNVNVLGKTATLISQQLKEVDKCSIYIDTKHRYINAKSIIGLLSGDIKEGDIVDVHIDDHSMVNKVMSILEKFGGEC